MRKFINKENLLKRNYIRSVVEDINYKKGLALIKAIEGKSKDDKLIGIREYARLVANEEKEELESIIKLLEIKASYLDKILGYSSLITTTTIADDYGMSARSFNNLLHEMGIQYKRSGVWHLYVEYKDKGYASVIYFDIGDEVIASMRWTHKGALFLYERLKNVGILPVLERVG